MLVLWAHPEAHVRYLYATLPATICCSAMLITLPSLRPHAQSDIPFCRGGYPTPSGGLVYYLSPPHSLEQVARQPIHAAFYTVFMLAACALFSKTWIEVRARAAESSELAACRCVAATLMGQMVSLRNEAACTLCLARCLRCLVCQPGPRRPCRCDFAHE